MQFLVTFLVALLRVFLPALVEASKDTCEEGGRQPELKARLTERVHETWGRAAVCVLLLVLVSGCGTRSIYVPTGEPVRLRETIKGAKVWVMGKDGKPVATEMDLPEGWYVLPDEDGEGERGSHLLQLETVRVHYLHHHPKGQPPKEADGKREQGYSKNAPVPEHERGEQDRQREYEPHDPAESQYTAEYPVRRLRHPLIQSLCGSGYPLLLPLEPARSEILNAGSQDGAGNAQQHPCKHIAETRNHLLARRTDVAKPMAEGVSHSPEKCAIHRAAAGTGDVRAMAQLTFAVVTDEGQLWYALTKDKFIDTQAWVPHPVKDKDMLVVPSREIDTAALRTGRCYRWCLLRTHTPDSNRYPVTRQYHRKARVP